MVGIIIFKDFYVSQKSVVEYSYYGIGSDQCRCIINLEASHTMSRPRGICAAY